MKQPNETPPVSRPPVSLETPVPQVKQVETGAKETGRETVRETTIVSAPNEDLTKWKKYAVTYYKRSRNSATLEARRNNRDKYEEYAELLRNAGLQWEESETLIFK